MCSEKDDIASLNILPCCLDLSNWELQAIVLLHIFNAELHYSSLVVYTAVIQGATGSRIASSMIPSF